MKTRHKSKIFWSFVFIPIDTIIINSHDCILDTWEMDIDLIINCDILNSYFTQTAKYRQWGEH